MKCERQLKMNISCYHHRTLEQSNSIIIIIIFYERTKTSSALHLSLAGRISANASPYCSQRIVRFKLWSKDYKIDVSHLPTKFLCKIEFHSL